MITVCRVEAPAQFHLQKQDKVLNGGRLVVKEFRGLENSVMTWLPIMFKPKGAAHNYYPVLHVRCGNWNSSEKNERDRTLGRNITPLFSQPAQEKSPGQNACQQISSVEAQLITYLLTTEMSNSCRQGSIWTKFLGRSENCEVKRERVGYHGTGCSRCLFLQVWVMWTIHWVGITKTDSITYKHIQMQTLRPHHILQH